MLAYHIPECDNCLFSFALITKLAQMNFNTTFEPALLANFNYN